jgi:hypothetical protein
LRLEGRIPGCGGAILRIGPPRVPPLHGVARLLIADIQRQDCGVEDQQRRLFEQAAAELGRGERRNLERWHRRAGAVGSPMSP